jgi:hypothetical protein
MEFSEGVGRRVKTVVGERRDAPKKSTERQDPSRQNSLCEEPPQFYVGMRHEIK